ncbi:lipopolysaccharide biosynthesis protein [Blastochloris viridis]|uniref:lipopolysaccharide biosynthesis protein n=1 Tax=Blastochloris viridis TaxID=1079 RepID=UPI0006D74B82|nr:lipopolysaccharide biosynthesis protein [Blastochloris viridis]ALK09077.1 MviN-like protein [Blastochloris viridis]
MLGLVRQVTAAGAGRAAATALLIRIASAILAYATQVILARWMGRSDFGIYVYVWTWTLVFGDLVHFGLAYSAQRFIPEYTQNGRLDLLRGFLRSSRWFVALAGTGIAAFGVSGLWAFQPRIDPAELLPLYLACATVPLYALGNLSDGIARTYNWVNLALLPPYILRPALIVALAIMAPLFGLAADAASGMGAAMIATWATAIVQLRLLHRQLARTVEPGPRSYDPKGWASVSFPIFLVFGFYTLFNYTDVIVLQFLRPSAEVATYFAAVKTLAPIAFINFSVVAAVAHRFAEHHVAGADDDQRRLLAQSIRATFWLSVAALAGLLPLGWLMLRLFGPGFEEGYPLLFVLALGLIARASVGPAERLLNMAGEQRRCTVIYACAFATNLIACIALIPHLHMYGAAAAVSLGQVVEATLLYLTVRRRLGLHAFVFFTPKPAP